MVSWKDFDKISNERSKYKIKCKCGHSIVMPNKCQKTICSWCGNAVYKSSKIEFKDKLKGYIIRSKKEDKNKLAQKTQ